MAESHAGVDAIAVVPVDTIRAAIRGTMVLGLPVEDAHKPTFYFNQVIEWESHDSEDNPWDWTDDPEPTPSTKSPVKPVCAYEFFSPLGRQGAFPTEVGDFNPTTLVVTMLEDEWISVRGFAYLTIGPSTQRWLFRFWRPSYGLGDMTVFQVHCSAEGLP